MPSAVTARRPPGKIDGGGAAPRRQAHRLARGADRGGNPQCAGVQALRQRHRHAAHPPAGADPTTALPTSENYGIDAQYNLIEIASNKSVMTGSTFSRVSYDMPGSYQRFARSRAFRDAEDRAAQEIAENIQTRLASFFVAGT